MVYNCFVYIDTRFLHPGNTYFHGYKSIQQVGDVDVFARILQFQLPVDAGKAYPFYVNIAKNYVYDSKDFRPFDILKSYDPDIYGKQYMFNDLRSFNREVILSNPVQYALHALSDLPKAVTESSPFLHIDSPQNLFSMTGLFYILQEFSRVLTYGNFLIFIIFPIAFIRYVQSKRPAGFSFHFSVASSSLNCLSGYSSSTKNIHDCMR